MVEGKTMTKWEKDLNNLNCFETSEGVWECIDFISSLLKEYAKDVEKVIGEDILLIKAKGYEIENEYFAYRNEILEEQRQALHKLNTTYGLKEKA